MKYLSRSCWIVKTILVISLLIVLTPTSVYVHDLNAHLFKISARIETTAMEKSLSKDVDVYSIPKCGEPTPMDAFQENYTKVFWEEINNDSNDSCKEKDAVERRIRKNWYNLLLLPGRIILWIFFSILCWLGI